MEKKYTTKGLAPFIKRTVHGLPYIDNCPDNITDFLTDYAKPISAEQIEKYKFNFSKRSGHINIKPVIDTDKLNKRLNELLQIEITNQKPNIIETLEFNKIVKKSTNAKELAIAFIKEDYKQELAEKEAELKEWQKKLDYFKNLNSITGEEAMIRENALELKRVNQQNSVAEKEILRLTEMKDVLETKTFPPYEPAVINKITILKLKLSSSIEELKKQRKYSTQFTGVHCYIVHNINYCEDRIVEIQLDIAFLRTKIEINNHHIEVLTQSLKHVRGQ